MIEVGDLVRIVEKSSYYLSDKVENKDVTGIVVDVTLDDAPNMDSGELIDYWVRVVFLDKTKATLFHDEVEIISAKRTTSDRL
jgi:hypothetical protein|tara:strand:+ start:1158 stop:1406 length:249 start_codon:yes stop_codon:yes gene_type:complete